jgi:MOSC domain-containing protein YiiM
VITITTQGSVVTVCRNSNPGLPKLPTDEIYLLEGLGVEGDYHAGKFVRHRSIAKRHPDLPNRRQVLITDVGIYAALAAKDIHIMHGMLGENVVIEGLAIMQVPVGTRLRLGDALVEVTEVRRPCYQLHEMDERLLFAVTERDGKQKSYKAGMMTCVLQSGRVRPGDIITIEDMETAASPTNTGQSSVESNQRELNCAGEDVIP